MSLRFSAGLVVIRFGHLDLKIYLEGEKIFHFYDRKPNHLQIHLYKLYLKRHNINFDIKSLSDKFIVRETGGDYPIIINENSDLEFLGNFLKSLYTK